MISITLSFAAGFVACAVLVAQRRDPVPSSVLPFYGFAIGLLSAAMYFR